MFTTMPTDSQGTLLNTTITENNSPADPAAVLRSQSEHLSLIFNHAREMMMLVRVEPGSVFRIVSVNRALLKTIGSVGQELRAEAIAGRTLDQIAGVFGFDAELTAQTKSHFQDVIRTRQMQEYDEIIKRSTGAFHGRTTVTPILDEKGECGFLLYSSRDNRDRPLAEQSLRESEEMFATAFRLSPDVMSISDLETGCYLEVNEAHGKLFGFTREEAVGKSPQELGIVSDEAIRSEMVDQLVRVGRIRDYKVRARTRDGRELIVLLSAETISFGGRKCVLRVTRDITDSLNAEEALRQSEEKFEKAFRASPDAISVSDLETGKILDINGGFERLSGYTRAELIGSTAEELGLWVAPGDRDLMLVELRRTGMVRNLRVQARSRSGEMRDFLMSAETVEIGGRTCLVILSHDISEELAARKALQDSEEKFATAFRLSPDIMSICDYETGSYIEINEAYEKLFGYSREDLIGRTAPELGLIEDVVMREELLTRLEQEGHIRDFKVRARTRAGRQLVLLVSAEMIFIGGKKCVLRVSRDITAALEAEDALRESEDKFAKAFLASAYALTITKLATGRYVDVNPGFERASGYSRAEAIGRTSTELQTWTNPSDRDELVRRLQATGSVREMEISFRAKSGKVVTALCSCELIEVAGEPCILSTFEDITERRRIEEQKAALEAQLRQNQKLEALGTLAGGIAHDFNNILTAIMVNQSLAIMDLDNPTELKKRIADIGQASNRAKELVQQILTFSRQQKYERQQLALRPVILEALSLVRSSLPATIEMDQQLAADAPPVLADPTQIHQIVMNLCTNAAHAMKDRTGLLSVRLVARSLDESACRVLPGLRPGKYVQLTVSDTGHGMSAAVLARLFEPFYTTKGPGEGTGLGLAVVHGIMKDYAGGIFVQSRPGEGTTFDLYFQEAVGTNDTAAASSAEMMPGQGESILVVDDERPICEAIGAMLQKIGYQVTTCSDPLVALEMFRTGPADFDLLLTDRTMPRLTGPELVTQIREMRPGLPALIMSGLDGHSEQREKRSGNSWGLLKKPLDIAKLSVAVRQAIDLKS
jgi:PAS domain S-box-containing protein